MMPAGQIWPDLIGRSGCELLPPIRGHRRHGGRLRGACIAAPLWLQPRHAGYLVEVLVITIESIDLV